MRPRILKAGGLLWLGTLLALGAPQVLGAPIAYAQVQPKSSVLRTARLQWNKSKTLLQLSVSFREVFTAEVLRKLRLGLPTTIVLTGVLATEKTSISTSFQRCKVTWHVWEEMYRIEVARSGQAKLARSWSPTVNGVLRRCAEVDRLTVARVEQVPPHEALSLHAKVLVNPVSPKLLEKITRWISRPSGTAAATPVSKLFSTFTGLFMTRVGDAEGELRFSTRPSIPLSSP